VSASAPVLGLARLLPAGHVVTDPAVLAVYSRDQAEGAAYTLPAAVARPRDTAEVASLVAFCADRGIPVVPRGAGTGLSGGANAVAGCVVLSLEAMNRIIRIDPVERIGVVQPGVVNAEFQRSCAARGLWYPPDPASAQWSTIGGNVSTNAGGLCCLKYGVTREYVLAMEVVVGSGEVVRLGRVTAKGVAGYDLCGLLVGSGGTLGVITEITLRLRGRRPSERTIVGGFADLVDAGRAVAAVVASGARPSALELVDRHCLQAIDDWKRTCYSSEGGNVLLLARSDAPGAEGEAETEAVLACFRSARAVWAARSTDDAEAEALFAARRLVYPALERHGSVLTEDVCVPRAALPEVLGQVERIAARCEVAIASLAHAGDGNLHPMIVVPRGDETVRLRGLRAMESIVDAAIAAGGTVTGEHGVGLLKMRGFAREVGPTVLALHRSVKRALDPAGIFNPGKVFDATAEEAGLARSPSGNPNREGGSGR
jgi:glycolate oxidase